MKRLLPAFLLLALPVFADNPAVTVNVDAAANQHPIDPRIYGAAWASANEITTLGLTLNRWGGNAMSRYNWAFSTANRCKDYYFFNIPDGVSSGDGSNGKSADDFIGMTFGAGAHPVMTIPMLSLLPKDRTKRCSFPIGLYPGQEDYSCCEPITCGNGRMDDGNPNAEGPRILGAADPNNISTSYPLSHQGNWVQHMIDTFGSSTAGGVRYYSLDNEPGLWSFDHWDVHPTGTSYDEVWAKMSELGAIIRAKDAAAVITGGEEWGWSGYFLSGLDVENGNSADKDAHGGVDYYDWLLDRFNEYEQNNGTRILDVLTVHFYPQSGEFWSGETTESMQNLRNRSTRSLWDPNYIDESWISDTCVGGCKVQLIPRLKEWVTNHYPGTQIGITEYNWGDINHINGATTQADILGIFGREGLDMAVRWEAPDVNSLIGKAFRMYRNYDGSQSKFGDTSVSASGPNPDDVAAFAALRSTDGALTVMLIAKTLTGNTPATVNLAGFTASRTAQRWQLTSTNTISHLADVNVTSSAIALTLPAQSITLLVIPVATVPDAPTIGAATPGNGSASIAFTPPANDGGANITQYQATCTPGNITGTSAGSPVTVAGLTNGVTYTCSVVAINSAGAGAASGTVNVTPVSGAPATFTATATSAANVALAWSAVGGATGYEIHRSVNNSAFSLFTTTGVTTTTNDPTVSANTTYLYKIRALTSGDPTGFSTVDAATTVVFTDDPLNAGTIAKATHITQLRTAVNAMRAAAGLTAQTFTDPSLSGVAIKAVHVTQLRTALDQARAAIGLAALTYTDPTLTVGTTKARAVHLTELRNGVK